MARSTLMRSKSIVRSLFAVIVVRFDLGIYLIPIRACRYMIAFHHAVLTPALTSPTGMGMGKDVGASGIHGTPEGGSSGERTESA